jgi:hypothetical protein
VFSTASQLAGAQLQVGRGHVDDVGTGDRFERQPADVAADRVGGLDDVIGIGWPSSPIGAVPLARSVRQRPLQEDDLAAQAGERRQAAHGVLGDAQLDHVAQLRR